MERWRRWREAAKSFVDSADRFDLRANLALWLFAVVCVVGGTRIAMGDPAYLLAGTGGVIVGIALGILAVFDLTARRHFSAPPEPLPAPRARGYDPFLIHDQVLWEDRVPRWADRVPRWSDRMPQWADPIKNPPRGPLCPHDGTPLFVASGSAGEHSLARDADVIGSGTGRLLCVECGRGFFLTSGGGAKEVRLSRAEAAARVAGRRGRARG